jgi:hypothetical protein
VELGLDTAHFRGARRWSDEQLKTSIAGARTWDEVIAKLGLSANSGSTRSFLKGHAVRLGIDYSHLAGGQPAEPDHSRFGVPEPGLEHLREAAASIAAAWFIFSGCAVSLPVEPAVYDLLAEFPDGIKRIQVKTTTYNSKNGWAVGVGHKPHADSRRRRAPYELSDIDLFFVIDGDLNMYLMPAIALAGAVGVLLRTYKGYIVGNASGLGFTEQPRSVA